MNLKSLALVNRRLRPIAQELLFSAPIINDLRQNYGVPPVINFTRTLLKRPDLANLVRLLRINVPFRRIGYNYPRPDSEVFQMVTEVIDRLSIHSELKSHWKKEMENFYLRAFCGVILSLVPKHNPLHLALTTDRGPQNGLLLSLFGYENWVHSIGIAHVLGLSHLTHLKFRIMMCFDLSVLQSLPQLTSLDITITRMYHRRPSGANQINLLSSI